MDALAIASSTLYIGGYFDTVGGQTRNRIAAVTLSDAEVTDWNPNADNTVYALALSGTTVYVGGDFLNIGGAARSRVAALDADVNTNQATSWNPNADNTVDTFAFGDGTLYVGGRFTHIGDSSRSSIAAFNAGSGALTGWIGNASYTFGTAEVNTILASGNTVYVGGQFDHIGSGETQRNHLAALDATTGAATSWNPNMNGSSVSALNLYGQTLYVGGYFWSVDDQDRQNLVALSVDDASLADWNPNPDNTVLALARHGTSLYVGGYFGNIELLHLNLASFDIQEAQFSSLTGAGLESASTVHIPIEINTALPDDATVDYAVTGGTATGGGVDYTLASGTATITAGATTTTISLAVTDDHLFEGSETVVITLSNPSDNVRIGTNKTFTYMIQDNDFLGYESNDTGVTPDAPGTFSTSSDAASSQDYSYWTTALSTLDGGYDSQVFKFAPDLTGITNPSFSVDWIGHGDVPDDKLVHLLLWNIASSTWDELASDHCADDCTLSGARTGTDYLDNNGNVWVWAKADNQAGAPTITDGDISDNHGMLPITWSTGEINADSELAYDQISHLGTGTSTWDTYASHLTDSSLTTDHSLTPSLLNNSTRSWRGVAYASSSNLLAATVDNGDIFTSTDHGATLTDKVALGTRNWSKITMSADGSKIAAYDTNLDQVFISTNGGSTWATSTVLVGNDIFGLEYSADGSLLAAAAPGGVYVSSNDGGTWNASTDTATSWSWADVAISADGTKLAAVKNYDGSSRYGEVYTSTTTGATWTDTGFDTGSWWDYIGSSANGSVLAVAPSCGYISVSTSTGAVWDQQNDPGYRCWHDIIVSADGTHIAAVDGNPGPIYTAVTTDGGLTWTWTQHTDPFQNQYWQSITASGDFSHLAAVADNGDLVTSDDYGATWTDRTGTVIYYRVRSKTADGDTTTSAEHSFVYGLQSSCPFVFTYDGSKYNFIIDGSSSGLLGSGGDLNLWKANPFYKATAYPNPLSYVKIPHGDLVPRTTGDESYYDLKTTFELNEVNYYDQTALQVIDHDPSVDVYPDYRNNGTIHTISKTAVAPVLVTDQDGQNVTSLVSADDGTNWHSSNTAFPAFIKIKLANGTTTPAHLKLLIKRGKSGNQTGGGGSDKLQYKNSSGNFVDVPSSYNPFTVTRAGALATSRNVSNTYGADTKVIDLSGLTIKDNEIRLVTTNANLHWVIDRLAVDTSTDQTVTTTTLSPYYADLHFRGVSEQVQTFPHDPLSEITQPDYDHLVKTVGAGNHLVGNATKYGDVAPLLASVDDKFVIAVQGDELALKYHIPEQAPDTERDFIYQIYDNHKSYHAPLGDTIAPLPFNAMTQYPYHEDVEHYPTDADHQSYLDTYNTREIAWGVTNNDPQPHHSLNTDFISLGIDASVYGISATPTATSSLIEWTSNSAASSQVFYSPDTSYASSTDVLDTDPRVASHAVKLSDLVSCSTYHYYVQSITGDDKTSASTDRTFTTTGCAGGGVPSSATSTSIDTTTTGSTSLTDSDTTLTVDTPSNFTSTSSSVVIQIKALDASTVLGAIGSPNGFTAGASVVFDIKALIDSQTTLDSFDTPVTITYHYSDADVSGLNESTLWMYHYHDGAWIALDSCSVDTSANTITCSAPSFSIFSLFGHTASAAPVVHSSGGGGSGGGIVPLAATSSDANQDLIKSLTAQIAAIMQQIQALQAAHGGTGGHFLKNLRMGAVDDDVKLLQQFLNTHGFLVAKSGSGSSGKETTHFGPATKKALIKYQLSVGLPGTGYFGPQTRVMVGK